MKQDLERIICQILVLSAVTPEGNVNQFMELIQQGLEEIYGKYIQQEPRPGEGVWQILESHAARAQEKLKVYSKSSSWNKCSKTSREGIYGKSNMAQRKMYGKSWGWLQEDLKGVYGKSQSCMQQNLTGMYGKS